MALRKSHPWLRKNGEDCPWKPYHFRISNLRICKRWSLFDKSPTMTCLPSGLRIMRGAFIIGQHWHFVILTKNANDVYKYVVSKTFDSVWLDDLKRIYANLQAVKALFCHDWIGQPPNCMEISEKMLDNHPHPAKISSNIDTHNLNWGTLKSHTAAQLIRQWAQLHKAELEANWRKIERKETLDKIEPLMW